MILYNLVIKMEEKERIKNYEHIYELRDFFKNGDVPDDRWIRNEREYIIKMYYYIPQPSLLHPEITDRRFREFCSRAEGLLKQLFTQVSVNYYFNLDMYKQMIDCVLIIFEIFFDESEDVLEMFNRLSV